MSIPQAAVDTHHLARELGSPLEAGEKMYQDLQFKYVESANDYQELEPPPML